MTKKIIGIIGGMGPLATADLFTKIIENTPAKFEQDHIHIIIDNNPKIFSRVDYLFNKDSPNPLHELRKSALRLQKAGADFLIMACNTAHYFYKDIIKVIDIPFINMIDEVANKLKNEKKIGLLATNGIYMTNLYKDIFKKKNIDVIEPTKKMKKDIMILINNIKSNENFTKSNINVIMDYFYSQGVNKIILGCTELPIAFRKFDITNNIVDSTKILAMAAIKKVLDNSI